MLGQRHLRGGDEGRTATPIRALAAHRPVVVASGTISEIVGLLNDGDKSTTQDLSRAQSAVHDRRAANDFRARLPERQPADLDKGGSHIQTAERHVPNREAPATAETLPVVQKWPLTWCH